jgi:hypothetical protein
MKWETATTESRIDWSGIKDRLCLGMVATNLLGAAHQRRGDRLFWLCPFHDDQHPSFEVNLTKKLWICRSCGHGGDAANLVMRHQKIDFPAAVRFLANLAGVITSPSTGVKPVGLTEHKSKDPMSVICCRTPPLRGVRTTRTTRTRPSGLPLAEASSLVAEAVTCLWGPGGENARLPAWPWPD